VLTAVSHEPWWLSAFLDLPPDAYDRGTAFWSDVTGYGISPPRGDEEEFATLVPPYGDEYLRVQRVQDGPPRLHLDVHVTDPFAVPAGASVVAEHPDYLTLRSPGGMLFCQVTHPAAEVPEPRAWPDGHRSRLDQVCLDVPPGAYETEFDFWAALTGWERREPVVSTEFARLTPPAGFPLMLLLQRLDDPQPAVTAHVDWSADVHEDEVEAHVAAGATRGPAYEEWTVLTDPVGMDYCITRRTPDESPDMGGSAPHDQR
jgi:hypothetical protein